MAQSDYPTKGAARGLEFNSFGNNLPPNLGQAELCRYDCSAGAMGPQVPYRIHGPDKPQLVDPKVFRVLKVCFH
ncbi:MAG: hypothetical protein KDA62_10185 [Planctomycetales bacterium]|nr:hypothetical protein [Planctomycetales bacterium]